MRFALVNNQRQEATPKTRGICPKCKKSVIAKCGSIRERHWAHEIALGCKNDRWEKEGPWHQNWKNQFPKEWQEQSVPFNNEIHILLALSYFLHIKREPPQGALSLQVIVLNSYCETMSFT